MRRTLAAVTAAGTLVAGGAVGAALTAGGVATAVTATPSPSATVDEDRVAERTTRLKEALAGLVADKTITQAQADKIAATLATTLPGPGGRGHGHGHGMRGGFVGHEAVAEILGLTEDELRAAHQEGKTLAEIAADQGISKATLISKMVAAAKAGLAEAVKDGRLTQAQADQISATLQDRITERVDHEPGDGPRHMGGGMGAGGMGGTDAGPAAWGTNA